MNDDVENRMSGTFSYYDWKEHTKLIITKKYKIFLTYFSAYFVALFGLLEVLDYFFPLASLPKPISLTLCIALAIAPAVSQCIHKHFNDIPEGLENETREAQKIAIIRKPFWEFKLAHCLISTRIAKTDSQIEDMLKNRIYVPVSKKMDSQQYIQWIQTRPENLTRMIESAKQLLIFDLFATIPTCNDTTAEIVRISNLISDLYESALEFHRSGKSISIPEHFRLIHEIQGEWITVIQDGFRQMLNILKEISERNTSNANTIEATIVFEEPPRIREFSIELDNLKARIYEIMLSERS